MACGTMFVPCLFLFLAVAVAFADAVLVVVVVQIGVAHVCTAPEAPGINISKVTK